MTRAVADADLNDGAIALSYRRLLMLALPVTIGGLSVPLLGLVDTAVVGRLGDAAPIAAVGLGSLIFNILFWMFGFLRMVTTGLAAQALGAHQRRADSGAAPPAAPDRLSDPLSDPLSDLLLRTGLIALGAATLLLLVQAPVGWLALRLLGLDGELQRLTGQYFAIRIWAAPATLISYTLLGWLIGVQRMRAVLALQLLLNGSNIALNLLFVLGLGWGVAGVAAASLLAEWLAAGFGLWLVLAHYPHRWPQDRTGLRARLRWPLLRPLFQANGNILLRTLLLQVAFALISVRGEQLGVTILAANVILMHFYVFQGYLIDGLAFVTETVTGEALGRGDPAAYRRAFWRTLQMSVLGALLVALGYLLLLTPVANVLTDLPAVLAEVDRQGLLVILICALSGATMQLDGAFLGATRTAEMRNAMLLALTLFLLAFWLLSGWGNRGLWLAFGLFVLARAAAQCLWLPQLFASVTPSVDPSDSASARRT